MSCLSGTQDHSQDGNIGSMDDLSNTVAMKLILIIFFASVQGLSKCTNFMHMHKFHSHSKELKTECASVLLSKTGLKMMMQ